MATATSHTDPWLAGTLARWLRIAGGHPPEVPSTEVYALEQAGDWQAAARAWTRLDCPYDAALAKLAGDPDAVLEAVGTFESLGARPAVAVGRARFACPGRPVPPRRSRANTYQLTARQLEILRLVQEGLTNTQIAARLHISPKTTDHHITAILAKTGVRSRGEAVRKLLS